MNDSRNDSRQQVTFGAVTVFGGEKNGKYPDGNSMIVRGADTTVLIDPSLSVHQHATELPEVDLVLLSHVHEDHTAGLHRFAKVPVRAHEADVVGLHSLDGLAGIYGDYVGDSMMQMVVDSFHYNPRPDAEGFRDGEVFDLGGGVRIHVIHLPGHTRGHSALLAEPDGVVFLGDIDLSSFGPYYGDAWSDLEAFEGSLAQAANIDANAWVTFHHVGVITDRSLFSDKLARFHGKIGERQQALHAFLTEPRSLDEMIAHRFVYPPHATMDFIDGAERRSIEQHLARMLDAGEVRRVGSEHYQI